jgi:hypothetical protein
MRVCRALNPQMRRRSQVWLQRQRPDPSAFHRVQNGLSQNSPVWQIMVGYNCAGDSDGRLELPR